MVVNLGRSARLVLNHDLELTSLLPLKLWLTDSIGIVIKVLLRLLSP